MGSVKTDKYTVDIEVRTIDIDGKQYITITHEVQEAHIPRMFERELSLEAIGVFFNSFGFRGFIYEDFTDDKGRQLFTARIPLYK